ncbi:hypothetical protein P5673_018444 [Acropora cervicornis]|uniref:Uncharacterized protein n=1 Tax=Acropora cervicornis TaxID=6130 RepID=A0AAD9V2X4_ACRCE|nr:hypothetical protein P5673_018444 [Acropora cervicornis]
MSSSVISISELCGAASSTSHSVTSANGSVVLEAAGWMLCDPVLHDKVTLLSAMSVIIFRTVRSHIKCVPLKERIINSLSRVSKASRTHLTILRRGVHYLKWNFVFEVHITSVI